MSRRGIVRNLTHRPCLSNDDVSKRHDKSLLDTQIMTDAWPHTTCFRSWHDTCTALESIPRRHELTHTSQSKRSIRSSTAHDLSTSVRNAPVAAMKTPRVISAGMSHELNNSEQWMSFNRQRVNSGDSDVQTRRRSAQHHWLGNPVHALHASLQATMKYCCLQRTWNNFAVSTSFGVPGNVRISCVS